jgi:hypothetical protein
MLLVPFIKRDNAIKTTSYKGQREKRRRGVFCQGKNEKKD